MTTNNISTNLASLERDIHSKVFFAHDNTDISDTFIPKLYVKSKWKPPLTEIPPWVDARLSKFLQCMKSLFHARRSCPNLLPFQSAILTKLRSNNNLLVPDANKGHGPCAIEYEQYIQDCLIHLTDTSTFECLSPTEAHSAADTFEKSILK
jgi:hypothetical protein